MGLLLRAAGLALLGGAGFVLIYMCVHIVVIELGWKVLVLKPARAIERKFAIRNERHTGRGNHVRGTVRRSEHGDHSSTSPRRKVVRAWPAEHPPKGGFVATPVRSPVLQREEHAAPEVPVVSPGSRWGLQIPVRRDASPVFRCPECGAESHHPLDVQEGYCGACHEYTGWQGDWPTHRLGFWPRDLQVKELGGIIVDDSSTTVATKAQEQAAAVMWFEARADGVTIVPRVPLDDLVWLMKLTAAAKETNLGDKVCFGVIDGGLRIKRTDSGLHYIDLIEMPLGNWYLFMSPSEQNPPMTADRSWAYNWPKHGEKPIRTAAIAALEFSGEPDAEPVNYTRRLS